MNQNIQGQYIVQYVGFLTKLSEVQFIERWTPFASRFKVAGVEQIDLYSVKDNTGLTFISRNIWKSRTYFENFPSGVAGAGSGGGIAVTQFGGYWIQANERMHPDKMELLFTEARPSKATAVRERCTEYVPYSFQSEYSLMNNAMYMHSAALCCIHLKTL